MDGILRRLAEGDMTAHSINENVTKDGRTIICQWTNTPCVDARARSLAFYPWSRTSREPTGPRRLCNVARPSFVPLRTTVPTRFF